MRTSLGTLTMEQAKPEELPLVMEIVDEAAAWLHGRGITLQWPSPMPKDFWGVVEKEIAKGEVYLARLADGNAAGTLRFEWSDPELWARDPDGGGYVHTLGTRPWVHGHGIGAAMLMWAKEHVRAHGKPYLRLDCWGENEALVKYYSGLGFEYCGSVPDEGWSSALFQMSVEKAMKS